MNVDRTPRRPASLHPRRALPPLVVVVLLACGSRGGAPDIAKTGATELEYELTAPVDPAAVQRGLRDAGLDVYRTFLTSRGDLVVQVPFAKRDPAREQAVVTALRQRFALDEASWAGNRVHLRATTALPEAELRDVVAHAGFEVTHIDVEADADTGEVTAHVKVAGPEARYEHAIEARFPVKAPPVRVESVGPARPRR